jgi:hypothetical protein
MAGVKDAKKGEEPYTEEMRLLLQRAQDGDPRSCPSCASCWTAGPGCGGDSVTLQGTSRSRCWRWPAGSRCWRRSRSAGRCWTSGRSWPGRRRRLS